MAKEAIHSQVAPLIHPVEELNNFNLKCRQDETLVAADYKFKLTGPRLQFQAAIIIYIYMCVYTY